jgi:four helix bundle protein
MAGFRRCEDIRAWQKARELVREVFRTLESPRMRRMFVVRDQFSRASLSVMSNVAEGFARGTNKDFARFLDVARGSGAETQSIAYATLDAGLIEQASFDTIYQLADVAMALVGALTSHLRKR